jgi:transposase
MVTAHTLEDMNLQALRELAMSLMLQNEEHRQVIAASCVEIDQHNKELLYLQAKIEQLTHEIAVTKRWKIGQNSERLDPAQASLLEETLDADIVAMEPEIEALGTPS